MEKMQPHNIYYDEVQRLKKLVKAYSWDKDLQKLQKVRLDKYIDELKRARLF